MGNIKLQIKEKAVESHNIYVKLKLEGEISDVRKTLKQLAETY